MTDPLHLEPIRPEIGTDGELTNPIGIEPRIKLRRDAPVAPRDLQPHASYVSQGFEYLTDENCLPARIRGGVRLQPGAPRHPAAGRAAGRLAAAADHEGGHIIAVSLGGFASGPNLFPQNVNFNRSAYARLENGWRRALRDDCVVEADIALTLSDLDRLTPPMLIVTWWENGEEWQLVLLNEPESQ